MTCRHAPYVPTPLPAVVPMAPSSDPLLAAKLCVPPLTHGCIRRQRLLDRLTEATHGPLTLITGPPGAGKTTLAAAWTRTTGAAPGTVVWVTLDVGDTPGVFWAYVLEAFRRGLHPLGGADR